MSRWVWWAVWRERLLTPQVGSQGGKGEAGEAAIPCLRAVGVGQEDGHLDGPRRKEADEDGAQNACDDEKDEEGGLGVDGGTHEAYKEAEGQQDSAVE